MIRGKFTEVVLAIVFTLIVNTIITFFPDLYGLYFISYVPLMNVFLKVKDKSYLLLLIGLGTISEFIKLLFIQLVFFNKFVYGDFFINNTGNIFLLLLFVVIYNLVKRKDVKPGILSVLIIAGISLIEYYTSNNYGGLFHHNVLFFKGLSLSDNIQSSLETFLVFSTSAMFLFLFKSIGKKYKIINLSLLISIIGSYTYVQLQDNTLQSSEYLNVMLVQQKVGSNNSTSSSTLISDVRVNAFISLSEELMNKYSGEKLDLLIWTESVILFNINDIDQPRQEVILERIRKFVEKHDIGKLVIGAQYLNEKSESLSGSLVITKSGNKLIRKKYKVPLLEQKTLLGTNEENVELEDKMFNIKKHDILVTICYEIIKEELIKRNSSLIINISNESIFKSKQVSEYTLNRAKRMARKNNSYLIKVGTPGYTVVIDNNGNIIKELPYGVKDGIRFKVPLKNIEKIEYLNLNLLKYVYWFLFIYGVIFFIRRKNIKVD